MGFLSHRSRLPVEIMKARKRQGCPFRDGHVSDDAVLMMQNMHLCLAANDRIPRSPSLM
jgi:hypothetical protein